MKITPECTILSANLQHPIPSQYPLVASGCSIARHQLMSPSTSCWPLYALLKCKKTR